ncbi:MAG: hypothetical protein HYX38_11900 [Rhodospirillales bacterium]|nr:hypothetical protein [Rhodospirillales bacterium]
MADPRPYPGTPRWVKAFGVIVLILAVVAIVTGVVGLHEDRHMLHGNSPFEGHRQ